MAAKQFSASALIDAPSKTLYTIIADYKDSHPHILPKPPFVSLTIEKGGIGAGTVMLVYMRVLGQTQSFRSVVTEPEPGRVLIETNDNGYVTTFTVDPRADGRQGYVTISTEITGGGGLMKAFERWFVPRVLRQTYVKELAQLADFAKQRAI